jgi:hypothetical protein
MNLYFTAAAPVVVGTNGGLVHAGNQGRTTGGTDRRSHIRTPEQCPLPRKTIHVRRGNGPLAVTGKVRRHIINHKPEDIGPIRSGRWLGGNKAAQQ